MTNNYPEENRIPSLYDVKKLIDQSKQKVVLAVNSEITWLYWNIGKRISEEILQNKRAEYGKHVIESLSQDLTEMYGRGWGKRHLHHCLKFAEVFPNFEIVNSLRTKLSWTHLRNIIALDNPLKQEFYIQLCQIEKWSSRQLQERIQSMLYERTAISKKPDQTIQNDLELLKEEQKLSPDLVFRDPYFLDFLGLSDTYSEKDLETAIISELQRFIIELGNDFALITQIRLFSSKRLLNKIGMIKKEDFEKLQNKLCQLIFNFDFTPPNKSVGRPERNSNNITPQSINQNLENSLEENKQ